MKTRLYNMRERDVWREVRNITTSAILLQITLSMCDPIDSKSKYKKRQIMLMSTLDRLRRNRIIILHHNSKH